MSAEYICSQREKIKFCVQNAISPIAYLIVPQIPSEKKTIDQYVGTVFPGVAGHYQVVRHIPSALSVAPDFVVYDVTSYLSEFMRQSAGRFYLDGTNKTNCFYTVLRLSGFLHAEIISLVQKSLLNAHSINNSDFEDFLENHFQQGAQTCFEQYGAVIVYSKPGLLWGKTSQHAAWHIFGGLIFHKVSMTQSACEMVGDCPSQPEKFPFEFTLINEAMDRYFYYKQEKKEGLPPHGQTARTDGFQKTCYLKK